MVAVVGISASSQANLLATIDSLGTNLLTVAPGQTFLGANEVLPDTAVRMIRHMPNVEHRARPSTRCRTRTCCARRTCQPSRPAGSALTRPTRSW